MISRQAVAVDPLSLKPASECKSPSSVCSDRTGKELAASFVFVESPAAPLRRHATVIHSTPPQLAGESATFLEGETKQAMVADAKLVHPLIAEGPLVVSNYRIGIGCVTIPLCSILDLKTYPSKGKTQMDVKTKDCRYFQILIDLDLPAKTGLVKLLTSLAFQIGPADFLPLIRLKKSVATVTVSPYRIEAEAQRLGLADSSDFVVSYANSDHGICHTYPRAFLVPRKATLETISGCAKFRDKGRIPILSWRSENFGSIWRSSQPKSSILNRSTEDELYLEHTGVMFIIDCRPMLNAYANIANGAGVESLSNYHAGVELWFAAIQNIHHVRDAWEKNFSLAQQYYSSSAGNGGWFVGLENGAWHDHICSIMKASQVLVEKISAGINVLCRCSHGLDRTPQVVALAMLCVDRFYRTIEGFAVLIEKEWVSVGHRFHSRFCIGQAPHDDVSPIFAQWLECVFQLLSQHPDEFEFGPSYLCAILSGVVSGRFGNFLFDSERERIEHGVLTNDGQVVDCIWPVLWAQKSTFMNHNFVHRSSEQPLSIDHRIAAVRIFNELWLTHKRIDI